MFILTTAPVEVLSSEYVRTTSIFIEYGKVLLLFLLAVGFMGLFIRR